MTSSSLKDQEFQWLIGQSLTPRHYAHLGDVWQVGQVWMSTKSYDAPESAPSSMQIMAAIAAAHKPGGERRKGLAKEKDLFSKDTHLDAKLFGDAPPKKP